MYPALFMCSINMKAILPCYVNPVYLQYFRKKKKPRAGLVGGEGYVLFSFTFILHQLHSTLKKFTETCLLASQSHTQTKTRFPSNLVKFQSGIHFIILANTFQLKIMDRWIFEVFQKQNRKTAKCHVWSLGLQH